MKWSLTLGKIAGIRILLHWTFWLLILWLIFSQARQGGSAFDIFYSLALLAGVFVCVLLHEFGHALTARRYGIQTRRIILLPIGGLADIERLPENPKQEVVIALAGPAVNLIIAGLIFLFSPLKKILIEEPDLLHISKFQLFWTMLFTVNLVLAVFNLIPAFPMDGGRVLRALLALRIPRARATRIAANIGQFIAILFIFFGLFVNPFLTLIGIFIFFAAYSENFLIQHQEFLKRYLVKDAMMTNFTKLSPTQTIQEVSDKIIAGPEHDFVVSDNGHALGLVTYPLLIKALKENSLNTPVERIMIKEFESINADESLELIFTKLQRDKTPLLPVVENDQLTGVISRHNINEFLVIRNSHN